ncbi:hypothetical protein A8W25_22620 [Streptomyces sp. ERV7]|uniref:hypothetical protein n=1 Tax=Streptomyces sp. ERV7 TaxID=1322334 RepID=UPI0007F4DCE1|nr:hypothetical protein [Streptomyces sp. ERV7]OAR22444.1 hypothetical protein A8W25_22620 [Streptomyces sp. ERV7]
MAEPNGGGNGGSSGGGGKPDLGVDGVSLADFKGRMEELLRSLEKSPARHSKIADQRVQPTSYGKGFAAADELHKAYDKVRTNLERLTKIFGDQIEGMGIAVHIADKGYGGIDVDEAHRYQAIRKETEKYYETPAAGTKPADQGPTAPGTKAPDKGGHGNDADSGGLK